MTDGSLFEQPSDGEQDPDVASSEPPPPQRQAGPPRGPRPEGEGVRIITAEEVAEAASRREAAERRAAGSPRHTDRPPPPADGDATASFPLPETSRPQDVQRSRPLAAGAAGAPTGPTPASPLATGASSAGSPSGAKPTGDPLSQDASAPLISMEEPTGEAVLPHWTAPATGEVPRVVAGENTDETTSSQWAAAATGPRWRDENARWSEDENLVGDLAHEQGDDVGALDADRPTNEQATSLDDVEFPGGPAAEIRGVAGPGAAAAAGAAATGSGGGRPGPLRGRDRGPLPPSQPRSSGGGTGGRNMVQAVAVGVALGVVALILAKLGAPWFLILVELAIVLAAAEYLAALRRAGLEPPTLLGLVAVAALPLAAYARGDAAIPMVLFLLIVFSMVWFLTSAGPGRPVRDIGTMMLAVVHVGVLGAFAALILRFGPLGGSTIDQGVSFLVLAVVAAVFYDVGGLLVGSRFGRTPLSSASPNKTREGLVGGIAASVVAVLFAVTVLGLTPFSFFQALVFAVVCAVAAVVGDLSESLVKRDLGLKDMGDLLPGHGGVFDRFDGMLFVLPTAYYLVLVLIG